ncbi:DUF357 domain-containing protein [Candidatus Woesearchaeota archaeon]|nr:DUF357 domain-containing protein [Candidatus Woesearchaeota archaeon]
MHEITQEKLDKYFDVTGKALKKVTIPETDYVKLHIRKAAEDCLDLAQRYFDDARHFRDKDDWVNAFAALSYAHGLLDVGARIGLFDVGGDTVLFAADSESTNELLEDDEQ